jgi:hypothetical protein
MRLHGRNRWNITGTPVNKSMAGACYLKVSGDVVRPYADLASMFAFLKMPYFHHNNALINLFDHQMRAGARRACAVVTA